MLVLVVLVPMSVLGYIMTSVLVIHSPVIRGPLLFAVILAGPVFISFALELEAM